MDDERAKVLYAEFMQLQEQAQALEQHLQGMQEQLRNIHTTKQTIQQLQQLETPTETWVPIAPGAFVKATTQPLGNVLLSVGSGVAVEKPPADVMTTLDDHAKVLDELGEGAVKELQEIFTRLEEIKQQVAAGEQDSNDNSTENQ